MKKLIYTSISVLSIMLTLWLMHYGSLTENSGALSKTGLVHPIAFAIWCAAVYSALHLNILYGLKKINRNNTYFYVLSAAAGIGMLLTAVCDFDYSLKVQYYLHCAGSLSFSAISGVMVFLLLLFQKNKSKFHRVTTIIIGTILTGDFILLLIFQENALIEAVPVIFGLIILPIFNFYIKDKEYAAQ